MNYGIDHLEMWRAMLSFFLREKLLPLGQFPKGEMPSVPTTYANDGKIDRALGLHVFLSVLCSVSL